MRKEPNIPTGWRLVRYGDVLKRRTEKGSDDELLSVTQDKGVIPQEESDKRDNSNPDKSRYLRIFPNDIVYNTMRMWQGASALSHYQGIVSPAYTVCKPTKEVIPEFIASVLKLPKNITMFHRYSQGMVSDTLSIRYDVFAKLPLLLPPIDEQKRIADILRDADINIGTVEVQITEAQALRYGAMQESFTYGLRGKEAPTKSIKRYGEIPEHWDIDRLENLSLELKRRNKENKYGRDNVLSVSNDIGFFDSDRELPDDLSRYKIVRHREFGYNPMRLNVGSIAFRKQPQTGMVSPDYVTFKCDDKRLAPEYLDKFRYSYGWHKQIEQSGTGSVRIRIYYKDIARFWIPLPSYEEQCEIVAILDAHDDNIRSLEAERDALREIKRGLMQKLLNGEVRV